jgi:ABC-type multidrug transport system permease subunit
MSNCYSTSAYFWGRSCATLPFEILFPLIFIAIAYFPCNLNNDVGVFFMCVLIIELIFWMAASYGLLISTLIEDLNVAMALVPVLIIPLMLVGGFFNNLSNVPKVFYPLEYISMFKYGFQALITNNYRNPIDCGGKLGTCDILT